MNLSSGGALLAADTRFDLGSRLTLYLIKAGRGSMPFVRMDGEVVWCVEPEIIETKLPDKMGIRFIELAKPVLEELELFVIEILERQFLALDARALAPNFICSEQLIL